MYDIALSYQCEGIKFSADTLKEITRDVLAHEEVTKADLSIALIDGETMRRLNREYLGHDYDTDVLSFSLAEESKTDEPQRRKIEGEILISATVARRCAAEVGWSAENETILYLVHGLLHLVGHDDQIAESRRAMIGREREHLMRWDLIPPGRDVEA